MGSQKRKNPNCFGFFICYEAFSLYYPDKEKEMREVLDLAINPTKDKEEIRRIVFSIGFWLEKEVDKYF